jgi:IPT/TIG domain
MARRRALIAALLVVGAGLALAVCSTAFAFATLPSFRVQRLCGAPSPGAAVCLGMKLVPASLSEMELHDDAVRQAGEVAAGASPAVTYKHPFAGYLTAQSLHAAYSLPTETDSSTLQTIAVVDAFNDPSAEADLRVYDETFGLPACTTANGCFSKINQEGHASPLPANEGEWASEISIDVQMAHAICQSCRVLLVEADNEDFTSLGAAVNAAVNAGATEISNSYAGPEEPSLSSVFSSYNAAYYDHPGVLISASSGDCGYLDEACLGKRGTADFPADSPDVLAVGGTSLTETGETWSSTVWDEGGSGCSRIFSAPLWQSTVKNFAATGCGEQRSVADVAAIGDPETGVDVYDSTPEGDGNPTGWGVWGGTSVASPIIAAEFALAGGSHGVSYPAATLYSHIGEADALYDVVSGMNGKCAGATACQAVVGFDGPTGVGSPIGLDAFAIPASPANTSRPTTSGVVEQAQTLTESPGAWSGGPTSRSEEWERCNSTGSGCAAIAGATGATYTLTAADVGSTIRVQETVANAAGIGAPAASMQTLPVVANVLSLTRFSPAAAITGTSVRIEGGALSAVTVVEFGGLAANFTVVSSTQIEAIVPNGARASTITVKTSTGSATSAATFTPTLSVTSFKPASGVAGKLVTIKGVGFNSHSTVSFDGHAATVTSVSAKKLKVKVPAGVEAGPIAVRNTLAPVGTVYSAHSFTP